jgi:ABC-type Fe3+ transport system permease subunit
MEEKSRAADRVRGPSIGLLVTAIVGACMGLVSLFGHFVGIALPHEQYAGEQELPAIVSFAVGTFAAAIGLAMAAFIAYAAVKMQRLQSYNMALVASILAMIPCISPCCILGLPIGIWALVVLFEDDVKRAFR